MPQTRLKLGVILMAAMLAAWVGGVVPLVFAKKPPPGPVAPVPETGQTTPFGPRDDGAIQAGVPWPVPRFTDHGNGTVTDHLTGLIWLQNAACFPNVEWAQALTAANTLSHGSCGLTDGSVAGDWRLPNVRELHSLIDFEFDNPALSNAAGTAQWTEGDAFSGAEATARFSDFHWSSTTVALVGNPDFAWRVRLFDGVTVTNTKVGFTNRVWSVRGGE